LALERYNATKQLFFSGDGPAIDTVEALINYQNRLYEQMDAQLQFANTTLNLSNFLWDINGNPQLLNENIVPVSDSLFRIFPLNVDTLNNAILNLSEQPELRFAKYKLEFQKAETKLRAQEILPMVRLNYNPLTAYTGFNSDEVINSTYLRNNYKAGFDIKYNLFTRKERGLYGMSKVMQRDAEYNFNFKQNAIEMKLREGFNKSFTLRNQQNLLVIQVDLSQRLLDAEERKFMIGESSLFLLNTREQKLLETKIKALDAGYKACLEEANFYLKSGDLFKLIN
jgi:outer membrane protein TolC